MNLVKNLKDAVVTDFSLNSLSLHNKKNGNKDRVDIKNKNFYSLSILNLSLKIKILKEVRILEWKVN